MGDRAETLGEVAWDVLRRMLRELLARKPGGHLVESELDSIELRIPLSLDGPDADPRRFAERLTATIDRQLDDALHRAAAFRPGHAYCHRCGGAGCAHSRPPSCRHVFIGYGPTGTPRWEDFAQYCLELKHPQVDRLFDQPPVLVTLIHGKRELHGEMLQAFHGDSYDLLGQVTAGFFSVKARAEQGRGVLALTVQVAASGARGRRPKLGLNILGLAPSGESLERLWEYHEDLPWHRAVRWAQSVLQNVSTGPVKGRRSPEVLQRRVDGIVRALARRLERDHRARARRTRHAAERHASGQRPTRKALDDAGSANGEAVLVDERSDTLVVLGERGRTHFFTRQGQHVSSVRYSKEAIARKLKLELWRPAPAETARALRARLRTSPGTSRTG